MKREQHRLRKAPEYAVWAGMHQRCGNKNCTAYSYYGGRGIKVCERWRSFGSFYADMGPRPTAKHSLERLDNDGDYSPENCVWAEWQEQCVNKRRPTVKRRAFTTTEYVRVLPTRHDVGVDR
jgi:hypothetical protein